MSANLRATKARLDPPPSGQPDRECPACRQGLLCRDRKHGWALLVALASLRSLKVLRCHACGKILDLH
jgi:hypothetical protein